MDIEASVTNDKLGIGLFCNEEMLGLQQAQDGIAEIGSLLEGLGV